jgi:hypothetical protein
MLALALAASACKSATEAWTVSPARLEEGIAACRAAEASAIERLQASHGACAVDSDCVPQSQVRLGCAQLSERGGVADLTAPARPLVPKRSLLPASRAAQPLSSHG